jgi:cell division control protein 45
VLSPEQLEKKIIESEGSQVKAFIMINCGGSKDLTKYWFAEKSNLVCLLLDSHRPINHNNINSKKNIIIIDDGHINIQNCPTDEGIEFF